MDYDSRILVSSVSLICQDFQCMFSLWTFSPRINTRDDFRKSLLCFTDAAFSLESWLNNNLENRLFVTNYSQDIYEQLQVHNFNPDQKHVLSKSRNHNGFSGYLLFVW